MANIWQMFSELVSGSPTLIGTVLSYTTDGQSILEMPGGGIMMAKGQGVAIGSKAFVQAGTITGEAPNLAVYEVVV